MKLTDEELESVNAAELADAVAWIDEDIGPERARATEYYRGELFGDEDDGRSQVVSRDVHDVVNAIMPSLMRVFFGPDRVVEFVPQGEEDVQAAEQATDYMNYIVTRDNPGFEVLYATFKDALIRKCGVIKWWWDEAVEVTTQEYTGLDDTGLTALLEDLQKAQKAELVSSNEDENGLSVTIRLTKSSDRARIAAVPGEEFLISRDGRTIEDARLVAHRCMKTVSDLVALGYDRDEVEQYAQDVSELDGNQERLARTQWHDTFGRGSSGDPSTRLVLYVESYLRVDADGDGIAELIKLCTVGPNHKILHQEPITDRPFAAFHPDPEPHTFFGDCPAEKVMDVQRIKSVLLRNALDGLSLSIFPRMVVGGDVNLDDVMNTEIGAIIRAKNPADVVPLTVPDTSKNAYTALTYMDEVKENRTGISKVSQGLDPKALQNATATAAAAQFSQAQQHIELIARIFAETGMKRVFRGLLKLVSANQRQQRMVQLRNRWVPVDPRGWRVDMDVTTNVALGAGTPQDQLTALNLISQKQEQVLLQAGPNNPLVSLKNLHETYTQMVQRMGFRNPDAFFTDPDSEDVQKRMAELPPHQDPKALEAQGKMQIEGQRLQQDGMLGQAKLTLDERRLQIEEQDRAHARWMAEQKLQIDAGNAEQDRATDFALRLADINGRNQTSITVATIKSDAEAMRANADMLIQASEHDHAHQMADRAAQSDAGEPA